MDRMYDVLSGLKTQVRIIFTFMYTQDMRNFLIAAYDLGMLNGKLILNSYEYQH